MKCNTYYWGKKEPAGRKERLNAKNLIRSHLKKRILVQDQGGAEFQTAGILKYVEDLKRGTNTEIGPKDFFEIASSVDQPFGYEEVVAITGSEYVRSLNTGGVTLIPYEELRSNSIAINREAYYET